MAADANPDAGEPDELEDLGDHALDVERTFGHWPAPVADRSAAVRTVNRRRRHG